MEMNESEKWAISIFPEYTIQLESAKEIPILEIQLRRSSPAIYNNSDIINFPMENHGLPFSGMDPFLYYIDDDDNNNNSSSASHRIKKRSSTSFRIIGVDLVWLKGPPSIKIAGPFLFHMLRLPGTMMMMMMMELVYKPVVLQGSLAAPLGTD